MKFTFNGKNFNTDDRTVKGQSAREYWAGVTGNDKTKYPGSSSSSNVKTLDDAKDFINANQGSDAASQTAANAPAIRSSIENYNEIAAGITGVDPNNIKAPDAPNFADTFAGLRADSGIAGLEEELTALNTQAEELAAQFRQQKADENGKFVQTNVANGRVSEHERAANERIDAINRRSNTVNSQLNTAYKVIDMTMNYKGMDYNAAVATYNTQFNNHMQAINLVKGIDDSIKTEQQHLQDNAQANLAVIYNTIGENGWEGMSNSQQSAVSKLEAQAGLPQGFYKNIKEKNPGGEIITTNSFTAADGKQYTSVVTRQKDGSLKTTNMYVGQGKVSSTGGDNAETRTADAISKTGNLFDQLKGGDGKVSPGVWNDARRIWTGSLSDFDSRFREYINPDHPADYAGFEEYRPGFRK